MFAVMGAAKGALDMGVANAAFAGVNLVPYVGHEVLAANNTAFL